MLPVSRQLGSSVRNPGPPFVIDVFVETSCIQHTRHNAPGELAAPRQLHGSSSFALRRGKYALKNIQKTTAAECLVVVLRITMTASIQRATVLPNSHPEPSRCRSIHVRVQPVPQAASRQNDPRPHFRVRYARKDARPCMSRLTLSKSAHTAQKPARSSAETMTSFHTDEYVQFLSRVTPETASKLSFNGTRCALLYPSLLHWFTWNCSPRG
jgi:hypothetical protein